MTVGLSLLLLTGCGSRKSVTQLAHETHRDTLFHAEIHYDSVYIHTDKLTDRSRDTVYQKETHMEYRYRLLRDTIHHIQRDSIPYEVVVYREHQTKRPVTQSGLMLLSLICIIYLILLFKRKSS